MEIYRGMMIWGEWNQRDYRRYGKRMLFLRVGGYVYGCGYVCGEVVVYGMDGWMCGGGGDCFFLFCLTRREGMSRASTTLPNCLVNDSKGTPAAVSSASYLPT